MQTSKRTVAMTEELKTVVTIISVLIIVGIFGHGLWSIRKNKEQLRDLKQPRRNEPGLDVKGMDAKGVEQEPLDADGLDSHGVGIPRTVGGSLSKQEPKKEPSEEQNKTQNQAPAKESVSHSTSEPLDNANDMPSFSANDTADEVGSEVNSGVAHSQTQSNEAANQQVQSDTQAEVKVAVNTEQSEPQPTASEATEPETAQPSEVLIVHVAMPDGQSISGASLLPLLISLGFKFGDMDIFHRHEDSAGHGAVLFSLASMYNPGTFDIDNIEQISTKGLSMFMTLPCKGEALANFNMMHNAAKKISEEFGGHLLDSNRSALTVQTVRHYVEKIREFERQRLING